MLNKCIFFHYLNKLPLWRTIYNIYGGGRHNIHLSLIISISHVCFPRHMDNKHPDKIQVITEVTENWNVARIIPFNTMGLIKSKPSHSHFILFYFFCQNNSYCFADLCPLFGCSSKTIQIQNRRRNRHASNDPKKSFLNVEQCNEVEVEKNKYLCESVMRK